MVGVPVGTVLALHFRKGAKTRSAVPKRTPGPSPISSGPKLGEGVGPVVPPKDRWRKLKATEVNSERVTSL